jgi:GT2 family glycosyltransferase
MTAISVVVLNWNGQALLATSLASLQVQTFDDFEVILVDNGSADGSPEWTRAHFPWVKVVTLDRNYGFCEGNNRGIAAASGRYVVLLNNDAEAHPDFLKALFEAVETHPEVGLCASRMLRYEDRSRVDSCGIGLLPFGGGYPIGAGKVNSSDFDRPCYVFGACAGAVLYRRSMLDQIGAFDKDFFSHIEDVDLSWRAQHAGYRCLYVPGAIVYHMGGATSRRVSEQVLYRIQRNLTWTYLKNMPSTLLIGLSPLHAAYSLYWLLRAARQGQAVTVWKAKRDALYGWPSLKEKRRLVQASRRLSMLSLLKLIDWCRV